MFVNSEVELRYALRLEFNSLYCLFIFSYLYSCLFVVSSVYLMQHLIVNLLSNQFV
jgi:hypothetical protein